MAQGLLKFNEKKFMLAMRKRPVETLKAIRVKWTKAGNLLLGRINRTQLSGRRGSKGLNKITGEAGRVLNMKTKMQAGDIIQTMFLIKASPARKYLPIHDKSHKDNIINHPGTNNGFGKNIKIPPYKIKMPVRVNIIETYLQKSKPVLRRAFTAAVIEAARG